MKIVIDGMDGAGKSTLAQKIATTYQMKYVDGLLHSFLIDQGFSTDEISIIDRGIGEFYKIENPTIRGWFLASANVFNLLNYTEDVVIDRSILTTYYWNSTLENRKLFEYVQTLAGQPDLTLILLASPEKRLERVLARNATDKDLSEKNKFEDGYAKFISGADFLHLNYVILDTDNKTADEVYMDAKIHIDRLKGGYNDG